jgi:hypothetical protein
MPQQLPSGRWRTRVRHPRTGKQMSARVVIGGPDTYRDRSGGIGRRAQARDMLRTNARVGVTVSRVLERLDNRPALASPGRVHEPSQP